VDRYEVDTTTGTVRQVSEFTPIINGFGTTRQLAAGASSSFDASQSMDPNGASLTYTWDFGDGATGSGATVNHVYATPGEYLVTLTLTDSLGATISAPQKPL
jgi:PKD repeat protein